MRIKSCYSIFGLLFVLMFLPTIVFAAPIEQVQVKIQDAGHHASDTLLARMTASIQVVAEQLLMDREIEKIEKS